MEGDIGNLLAELVPAWIVRPIGACQNKQRDSGQKKHMKGSGHQEAHGRSPFQTRRARAGRGQAPFSAPEDRSLLPKKVPDPLPPGKDWYMEIDTWITRGRFHLLPV
jgi:hypothetical protein